MDDLADACIFLAEQGYDVTIAELAQTVMNVVGFAGPIVFDASKPDGAPARVCKTASPVPIATLLRAP